MGKLYLYLIVLNLITACNTTVNPKQVRPELSESAHFALSKPIKTVIDSLRVSADQLTFTDEPPGILRSVSLEYSNNRRIEFFFERTSIISDHLKNKEEYLQKVADKIIEAVEWEEADGKKFSLRSVKTY